MANTAADNLAIIASGAHGATTVGVVKAVNGQQIAEYLAVRGQGAIGPTSKALYRKDSRVSVTFAGGVPIATGTKASLVITGKKMDMSTTVAATWTNMKAGSYSFDLNDDSPPEAFTQQFEVEDSMATDNFSITGY